MLQCDCVEELNMKRSNKYIIMLMLLMFGASLPNVSYADTAVMEKPAVEAPKAVKLTSEYSNAVKVSPLDLVKNPAAYLNKTVVMTGKFDKFSTVGLDYPPALRKTEDYISLMIYRDDTQHDIPLSELKMFMKREDAQKFIELKSKDNVKITGKVFSAALGDPWVDVLVLENVK